MPALTGQRKEKLGGREGETAPWRNPEFPSRWIALVQVEPVEVWSGRWELEDLERISGLGMFCG